MRELVELTCMDYEDKSFEGCTTHVHWQVEINAKLPH